MAHPAGKWQSRCDTDRVTSQHRDPALTVRPDPAVRAAGQAALDTRSRGLQAFITACLACLAADPDRMLALLDPYWPPTKKPGRPPRKTIH